MCANKLDFPGGPHPTPLLQSHYWPLAGETPTLQGLQALQHLLLVGLQELPHALVIRLHEVADTGAGHIHALHHRLHQRPLW